MFLFRRFKKKRAEALSFDDIYFMRVIPMKVRSLPFLISVMLVLVFLFLDFAMFGGGVTLVTYLWWIIAFFVVWFILVKINVLDVMGRLLYFIASRNVFKVMNLLPGIDMGDLWIVEEYGEPINLSSRRDWFRLMKRKSFDFIILFPGTFAFVMRVFIWLIDKDKEVSTESIVLGIFLFPMLYFLVVIPIWIIDDSGIKIVEKKSITYVTTMDSMDAMNQNARETIEEVTTLGRVFRGLVTYFVGVPSLLWFADRVIQSASTASEKNQFIAPVIQYATNVVGAAIVIVIIIIAGFPLLHVGTMLYYNRYHAKYVNSLRVKALEGVRADVQSSVIVGTLTLHSHISRDSESYLKHVENLKNRILQKWRTPSQ